MVAVGSCREEGLIQTCFFCKTPTEDDADHDNDYGMGWKVVTVCDGCRACRQ